MGDGIADETVTKLMHDEIGIDWDTQKIWFRQKYVYLTIKNYKTHQTFRFKISNLKNIRKSNKKIQYY